MASWVCSVDGKRLYLNEDCRSLLGVFHVSDLRNGHWANHVKTADRKRVLADWETFLRGSEDYFKCQFRWVMPNCGRTIHLNARVQRLPMGWFEGWLREADAEIALSKLAEISK